jgi:Ala-tRNA(Pro) deacylase
MASMRIYHFLQNKGIQYQWIQHAPAFSAQKLAKTLRIPGRFIAKSVLLKKNGFQFIAVLAADSMLDRLAIENHLDGKIQFANSIDISETFFDCEWGVVPAIGSAYNIPAVFDSALLDSPYLILQGHSHMESLKLNLRDYLGLENPKIFDFSQQSLIAI